MVPFPYDNSHNRKVSYRSIVLVIVLVCGCVLTDCVHCFSPSLPMVLVPSSTTSLGMGMKNKQFQLLKKLELARKKQQENENKDNGSDDDDDNDDTQTQQQNRKKKKKQTKETNDNQQFAELLKRNVIFDSADESSLSDYRNPAGEQEEMEAFNNKYSIASKGINRKFEGDAAPTICFEELISCNQYDILENPQPIGAVGKEKLVPWLGKGNQDNDDDYLVIVANPDTVGDTLYNSIILLKDALSSSQFQKCIFVNTDRPLTNQKWYKQKFGAASLKQCQFYADSKERAFMKSYTAINVGANRLYMTVFIIQDYRIKIISRDVSINEIKKTVINGVKSLETYATRPEHTDQDKD